MYTLIHINFSMIKSFVALMISFCICQKFYPKNQEKLIFKYDRNLSFFSMNVFQSSNQSFHLFFNYRIINNILIPTFKYIVIRPKNLLYFYFEVQVSIFFCYRAQIHVQLFHRRLLPTQARHLFFTIASLQYSRCQNYCQQHP